MEAQKKALKQICQHKENWFLAFEKPDMLSYLLIAEIGREIVEEVKLGNNKKQLSPIFDTIEEILKNTNDINVTSLIVAGMFNAMQNKAYDELNPPDIVSNYLGKESLRHWEEYIEGWTGKDIRTIEAWKNKSTSQ